MGKVIVIGSQKGGVGKTTTTLNLAYSLHSMGKKVLAIDFDSQANLTTCYGVENTNELEYTIGHLMMAQIEEQVPESLDAFIQSENGVDFIPSSIYLSVVDAKLRTEMGAERMLAEVLEHIKDRYDYVLIDTCPSLGMLTINALAAADEVIITVNPQLLAMMGLQDFLRTVSKIKKRMAEDLFLPLKGGEVTAANAAALSGKLMQMANGAVYSDDGDEIQIHDQKLDALEDLIEAANGKPVMVAYWFRHDLTRIMRRLSEMRIYFEMLDSEESIRKWNRGELSVALIHPASAGHGLNLQSGGNMLIWFGLTWSLELYQQTVARLWRQGQSAETVVVQHIITAGTIDEQVMKALESKIVHSQL